MPKEKSSALRMDFSQINPYKKTFRKFLRVNQLLILNELRLFGAFKTLFMSSKFKIGQLHSRIQNFPLSLRLNNTLCGNCYGVNLYPKKYLKLV